MEDSGKETKRENDTQPHRNLGIFCENVGENFELLRCLCYTQRSSKLKHFLKTIFHLSLFFYFINTKITL